MARVKNYPIILIYKKKYSVQILLSVRTYFKYLFKVMPRPQVAFRRPFSNASKGRGRTLNKYLKLVLGLRKKRKTKNSTFPLYISVSFIDKRSPFCRYTVHANGSLTVHRVRPADEGMYRCMGIAADKKHPQAYGAELQLACE